MEEVSICKYVVRLCLPSLERPKSLIRKEGFFALSVDSVIPSSDEQLNDLLDRDIYRNTFHLYCVCNKSHSISVYIVLDSSAISLDSSYLTLL